MTGDPDPRPGIATFHFTFLVSLHSIGGCADGAVPLPVGPRQWAQLSAIVIAGAIAIARIAEKSILFIGADILLCFCWLSQRKLQIAGQ
jgi:hypothetical protein